METSYQYTEKYFNTKFFQLQVDKNNTVNSFFPLADVELFLKKVCNEKGFNDWNITVNEHIVKEPDRVLSDLSELKTAALFKELGFEISFVKKRKNSPTPDLVISKAHHDIAVEVKRISGSKWMPKVQEKVSEISEFLGDFFRLRNNGYDASLYADSWVETDEFDKLLEELKKMDNIIEKETEQLRLKVTPTENKNQGSFSFHHKPFSYESQFRTDVNKSIRQCRDYAQFMIVVDFSNEWFSKEKVLEIGKERILNTPKLKCILTLRHPAFSKNRRSFVDDFSLISIAPLQPNRFQ